MNAYIVDTETTGVVDPEVVEIAWAHLPDLRQKGPIDVVVGRYNPSKEISLGAVAVHHILPGDLAESASPHPFNLATFHAELPVPMFYMIGHNIDFDWKAMGQPEVRRICTLALARQVWPTLDSHTQSALLYYLHGRTSVVRDRLRSAHSAEADVYICRDILEVICQELQITSFEDLYAKSEIARVPTIMPFGKFKGMPISAVDRGWRNWYAKQEGADPYILKAFERN